MGEEEEDSAATKIQAVQRGKHVRKEKQVKEENSAATKIQAVQRGQIPFNGGAAGNSVAGAGLGSGNGGTGGSMTSSVPGGFSGPPSGSKAGSFGGGGGGGSGGGSGGNRAGDANYSSRGERVAGVFLRMRKDAWNNGNGSMWGNGGGPIAPPDVLPAPDMIKSILRMTGADGSPGAASAAFAASGGWVPVSDLKSQLEKDMALQFTPCYPALLAYSRSFPRFFDVQPHGDGQAGEAVRIKEVT